MSNENRINSDWFEMIKANLGALSLNNTPFNVEPAGTGSETISLSVPQAYTLLAAVLPNVTMGPPDPTEGPGDELISLQLDRKIIYPLTNRTDSDLLAKEFLTNIGDEHRIGYRNAFAGALDAIVDEGDLCAIILAPARRVTEALMTAMVKRKVTIGRRPYHV